MIYEGLILIEQDLKEMIESNLGRTGLLYRIYSRIKSNDSINEKINRKNYQESGKLIQDVIGIRVMTYFSEDIDVLIDYFSSIFDVIDLEHDKMDIANFNPVRINMVCRLQNEQLKEFNTWKNRYSESFKRIDSTFEIQVRTTLSEGWHEIEHNMRYKCKKEWQSLEDESIMLNGFTPHSRPATVRSSNCLRKFPISIIRAGTGRECCGISFACGSPSNRFRRISSLFSISIKSWLKPSIR